MGKHLKEAGIYLLVAISSLFIMGSVVHMLVGGQVSDETETLLIVLICLADVAAISYMAWDVIQRRRGLK